LSHFYDLVKDSNFLLIIPWKLQRRLTSERFFEQKVLSDQYRFHTHNHHDSQKAPKFSAKPENVFFCVLLTTFETIKIYFLPVRQRYSRFMILYEIITKGPVWSGTRQIQNLLI